MRLTKEEEIEHINKQIEKAVTMIDLHVSRILVIKDKIKALKKIRSAMEKGK